MEKIIIIRYAEIHLKGKNRGFFERVFTVNLERSMKGLKHELRRTSGRYLVENFDDERTDEICERISRVFGVHSYSVGLKTESSMDGIFQAAITLCPQSGTFKVESHRANKKFPLTSMQINAELGGRLLSKFHGLRVDVHNPEAYVYVDVRENGTSLVFSGFEKGLGGMPVGTAGKGLLLLSGGIDSPVAGYQMAKRGMTVEALHFHSYPYTNDQAKEKVVELARILSRYSGTVKLRTVSVTHIQEEIHKNCAPELMITLLRRFMYRIAERTAKKIGAQCLVTGESLGQVASQTIEGITSSNSVVEDLPVLRPLIGFDKEEIIERSVKMGAYQTSIQPFEDCCTVFLPEFPAIKPKMQEILQEESKLNVEALLEEALATTEVLSL